MQGRSPLSWSSANGHVHIIEVQLNHMGGWFFLLGMGDVRRFTSVGMK